ncbi:uncharacterized protein TNIN_303751 [Trichonephila inaurata madagascariensis]|uniref:DNA-directed DNA polymerase n=1 Tax=Trichonephila inaurata madagascariensis TaxID=2747483 RepID=A0A8X6JQK3_9ARAC|nr:uncharacterized protein TNIN_303751 [Trichonephila inaurata madagascariensis]
MALHCTWSLVVLWSMLKTTGIELELLTDSNINLMLEKGTRGRVSQYCNRYEKTNNEYMKNYDKTKESNYLMYLDANNLYGWAMSQFLPYAASDHRVCHTVECSLYLRHLVFE